MSREKTKKNERESAMVTTIKITTDGVFIQTNSNNNASTLPRIRSGPSINGTNRLSNGHIGHHNGNDDTNKTLIVGIANSLQSNDNAPQSLPTLPISGGQSDLISPYLVKTITRTRTNNKKSTSNGHKIAINGNSHSASSSSSSSASSAKPIHKIIRIDKNGNVKCIQRTANGNLSTNRQWDSFTSQRNGCGPNNCAAVRRRNTFKHYLIECKENLVRRLSTSTPIIG